MVVNQKIKNSIFFYSKTQKKHTSPKRKNLVQTAPNGKFVLLSTIQAKRMYDVFFLSYNEPMADAHWRALSKNVPSARRINGIKGIHAAHRECANRSRTSHFFVVDGDNEILDYDFTFKVDDWDKDYVHLWYARNPINHLEYGWGGVKLFPKKVVKGMSDEKIDMTTSFELKVIPEVKSITHYNTSPFDTWRSAFREAVKLTIADDVDSKERLLIWTTQGEGIGANESIKGARSGLKFASENLNNKEELKKINDYDWLLNRMKTEK